MGSAAGPQRKTYVRRPLTSFAPRPYIPGSGTAVKTMSTNVLLLYNGDTAFKDPRCRGQAVRLF